MPNFKLNFGTFLARKDFPVRSSANNLNETETENFLKTLPEEQRSLLQAAIRTGELDARSLQSAIGLHFENLKKLWNYKKLYGNLRYNEILLFFGDIFTAKEAYNFAIFEIYCLDKVIYGFIG